MQDLVCLLKFQKIEICIQIIFSNLLQTSNSGGEHLVRERSPIVGQLLAHRQPLQRVHQRDALRGLRREELHGHRRSQLRDGESRTEKCDRSHPRKVRHFTFNYNE